MFNVLHGRGRQSGLEVASREAMVARWRDGLVVSLKAYVTREEALRDLNVSEESLERLDP